MTSDFSLYRWKIPLVISEKIKVIDSCSSSETKIVLKNLKNLGGSSFLPYVPEIIISTLWICLKVCNFLSQTPPALKISLNIYIGG